MELLVLIFIIYMYNKYYNPKRKKQTQTQKKQINKFPIDDHCIIEESFDPIQNGAKANSLFGNFFGNKSEKL